MNEEGVEEDPRQELVEQLLQYKMYKYVSYELVTGRLKVRGFLYKESTIPEEVKNYEEPVHLDELLGDLTLTKLNQIFRDVIKKQGDKLIRSEVNLARLKRKK